MLVKPEELIARENEWRALVRFLERRQRLAVVYGPRRVGKSYLLDAFTAAAGGHRYQAIEGTPAAQLADFGRALGEFLNSGPLALSSWSDAFERVARLNVPVLVIDELPYLTETSRELASVIQRYVDGGVGPSLVLAGSSFATMKDLVAKRAPLYGRSSATVVPSPFFGRDLAALWGVENANSLLWIDAAVGGLPGYRPLLAVPGDDLDSWMTDEVLAPSSPLLDAAEVTLAETSPASSRGLFRTILSAIAMGEHTFNAIARVAGQPTGALSRPLSGLERAGLVVRVPDPLRSRRDTYDLADPHLRMWLSLIAPYRSRLQAGRASQIWTRVGASTWRDQVLGPRWESVAREYVARGELRTLEDVTTVGETSVSDQSEHVSRQVDIVAMRGRSVAAIGEAKLRHMNQHDVQRLRHIRDVLKVPDARLILASMTGVDEAVAADPEVITVIPQDIYG